MIFFFFWLYDFAIMFGRDRRIASICLCGHILSRYVHNTLRLFDGNADNNHPKGPSCWLEGGRDEGGV